MGLGLGLPVVPRCREVSARGRALPRMGCSPHQPSASHGGFPNAAALRFPSWRWHSLLARHQGDGAMLRHCRPDSSGARLCQLAGLSKDMSGIIITHAVQAGASPCRWLAEGHPARTIPARSCLHAARGGRSTGDPWG